MVVISKTKCVQKNRQFLQNWIDNRDNILEALEFNTTIIDSVPLCPTYIQINLIFSSIES